MVLYSVYQFVHTQATHTPNTKGVHRNKTKNNIKPNNKREQPK